MQFATMMVYLATASGAPSASTSKAKPRVLVTGATGKTGQLLYRQLKQDPRIGLVRAFVHSGPDAQKKAAAALHCGNCDETDGIFYGDVTNSTTLQAATFGMDTIAIAVGASPFSNASLQKAIEFSGVVNQVMSLAKASTNATALAQKQVVLCSSMGTTEPNPKPYEGGGVLFWKLNAEAFLGSSGIGATIVKPCGIEGAYGRGGKQLVVGHGDDLPISSSISREDLAAVMVEAVAIRARDLRFDLCVGKGPPTKDLTKLLEHARWSWEK